MKRYTLLLLLGSVACDAGPTGPSTPTDAAALTVTDSAEYTLPVAADGSVLIHLVFSNRTGERVWLVRCGGPRPDLEKLVGDEWVKEASGPELACLQATSIETGGQLRTDYRILAESLSVEAAPGTYRLVWSEAVWHFETRTKTSLFGDLLPLEYRVSNQFELRDPTD